MTQKELIHLIDQRIKNLQEDQKKYHTPVAQIVLKNVIGELMFLKSAIKKPDDEIYTSLGLGSSLELNE